MSEHDPQNPETPAQQASGAQASGAGNGGIVPPVGTRFKPGESGNPSGKRSAGHTIREWINTLSEGDHTEEELRRIARDKRIGWTKRLAAERILRSLEHGDLADFAPLLKGEADLPKLREDGINTEVVKKIKQKSRVVPVGEGETEEIIEREIELHDRAGEDFDRIIDRTLGKPAQSIDHTSGGKPFVVKVLSGVRMDDL